MNVFIALIDGELKWFDLVTEIPRVSCPIYVKYGTAQNSWSPKESNQRFRYQTIHGNYRHIAVIGKDSPHVKVLKTMLLLEGIL